MTPIEQVRPPMPGNWARRPEGRNKRGGQGKAKGSGTGEGRDRSPGSTQPGKAPGQGHGGDAHGDHEHSIDELA